MDQHNRSIQNLWSEIAKRFEWPKNIDESFKYENEFIMKSNKSLTENEIKNQIEQLLWKCNHENNIHEYGKHQNEWVI